MRALTASARPARRRGAMMALVVAAAVGAAFGGAPAASAHDSLVAATPSADEVVSTASEVELTFSANLLGADGGNEVIVVGPDDRHYETDCTALAGPALTTPVQLGPEGEYEVTWRAVSSDGHPVSGTYVFSYAPAAGEPASEGSTESPCATVAAQQTGSTDAMPPAAAPSGLVIGLSVGGVAVIVVGVVVALLVRPRRDGDSGDE